MHQRRTQSITRTPSASRPGPGSLLLNILRCTFADGMQFPALLGIGLTVILYRENFPYHEAISLLLAGGIVLIGLLRGCYSWQQDLGDYQRELALLRQRQAETDPGQCIPGFIPYTRR